MKVQSPHSPMNPQLHLLKTEKKICFGFQEDVTGKFKECRAQISSQLYNTFISKADLKCLLLPPYERALTQDWIPTPQGSSQRWSHPHCCLAALLYPPLLTLPSSAMCLCSAMVLQWCCNACSSMLCRVMHFLVSTGERQQEVIVVQKTLLRKTLLPCR